MKDERYAILRKEENLPSKERGIEAGLVEMMDDGEALVNATS